MKYSKQKQRKATAKSKNEAKGKHITFEIHPSVCTMLSSDSSVPHVILFTFKFISTVVSA